MFKYLVFVSSLLIFTEAVQRWHTSQIMLTKLYDLQNDHFNALEKYLDLEAKRLEELKNNVAAAYEWHDRKKTYKHFLNDHLDVIGVMKQMHHHFSKIEDLINDKQSIEALKDIDEHKDLSGNHILWAYRALRRLQLFYAIPASDMSAGRINESIIGDRMDACECRVMAKYCLEGNDMYGVLDWAVEAYQKWEIDGRPECVNPNILNYYIISSSIYTGFNFMSLLNPSGSNYQDCTEKFVRYYHLIRNELFELEKERVMDVLEMYYYLERRQVENDFRYLCKHGVSRTLTKYLKCRYQTNNLFYRILMPFKEEDINSEPFIKLYHDVLYDDEILKIKTISLVNMKDAEVRKKGFDSALEERTRSGQVNWITASDAVKYFYALNTRIESFTGFSTKTAELYQIVNYGLGGHYLPHNDPFLKGTENPMFGNRLVTVLFYLTDVPNDGYTVFPRKNIVAPTEKGAALVWHNLHMSNGEINYETLHGSCPLLKGNKWSTFANGINWHSSQVILRHLYDLQDEQFAMINKYLELETKRLHDLERIIFPITDWYINYSNVKYTIILSHVRSLKLMSRVYNNLSTIKKLMNNTNSVKVIKQFDEQKSISEFNMQSAYRSIKRIQKVYAIPASEMATGRYKDRVIGDPMDACECYVMSKYSFEEYDSYGVLDWAVQAYNKWLTDRQKCVDIDKLHYYTRSASMTAGFSLGTLSDFNNLNHSENTEYSAHFSLMGNALNIRNISAQSTDIYDKYDDFEHFYVLKQFRKLCRTGKSMRPLTCDFKCRYQTKNSPYRILMPFKEEDISSDPNVKLYHDIIYDEEIKTITDMASKDLSDAEYYSNGKITLLEDRRLGQLKWFSENVNPALFGKLNERIECITDYSTKTAEGYQTVNYGLGGHFSVHVDAFTDGLKLNGNRLVTILFYMTDVPNDGYTVFPNLNYVAHCSKGTALVWLNLYLNNGSINSGTFHGGCPVIKGNKWIMTKGIYEEGQHLTYNWRNNEKITIV